MDSDFWSDNTEAQRVTRKIKGIQTLLSDWETVEQELNDTLELARIAGDDLEVDISKEVERIKKNVEEREFFLLFSGSRDSGDAILSIHSGTGGVDAQDCAGILLRMYLRFAERNGFEVEVLHSMMGLEAGIKKAVIEIRGSYAYGKLRSEAGTHRFVRLSPFNADNLRQTSFVLVEVEPVIEDEHEVEIDESDLRVDTFKSSGAGGQHVNKTNSAIRITHIPTGIVVGSQQERSQHQNRRVAMKLLRSKLYVLQQQAQASEQAKFKGEHKMGAWGNQIRSYVYHPYQMVKDHRTEVETGNIHDVVDGNLDIFIEGYLRWMKESEMSQKTL
jgi:peptide chain release factor 2